MKNPDLKKSWIEDSSNPDEVAVITALPNPICNTCYGKGIIKMRGPFTYSPCHCLIRDMERKIPKTFRPKSIELKVFVVDDENDGSENTGNRG